MNDLRYMKYEFDACEVAIDGDPGGGYEIYQVDDSRGQLRFITKG